MLQATAPSLVSPLIQRLANAPPTEELARRLAVRRYPFFLDSSARDSRLGRFSFLGCDPFLVMRSRGRMVSLQDEGGTRLLDADPFDCLESLLRQYRAPQGHHPMPFVGGAVGYLSYDLGRLAERIPVLTAIDQPDIPEACIAFYDAMYGYDHQEGVAYAVSTGLPLAQGVGREKRARERAAWLLAMARDGKSIVGPRIRPKVGNKAREPRLTDAPRGLEGLHGNFTRTEYLGAVERARTHIIAGDIYQVNLSQRFQAPWAGSGWDLYERLRVLNPAPFAAYMDYGDVAVLSSSPERFLRLSGDVLETRPIKGTRPRGRDEREDIALGQALLRSAKDQAEHIMIVDLERSDLGRVCRVGSVTVDQMMALEQYATVFHLTSTIRGLKRDGASLAEVLRATFPGGSITGAPKVRAMEIIEEIEPVRRGVYTGAIGYFSLTGDFDLSIAIRTIVLHGGVASLHVGGGIVYDSLPEAEYQETIDKGMALFGALSGIGA